MRMNEISFERRPPIDAYGGGGFTVGGLRHLGGLALLPERMEDWAVQAPDRITPEAVAPFLAAAEEIDVLLIGLGADVAVLPRPAREALEAAGIGVEPMSTPSACRTFNVLLAEDRRVAAALIAV
ncbi:MAG: Mth938-like domain-containing protein [Pseudomonadota bacterium]